MGTVGYDERGRRYVEYGDPGGPRGEQEEDAPCDGGLPTLSESQIHYAVDFAARYVDLPPNATGSQQR